MKNRLVTAAIAVTLCFLCVTAGFGQKTVTEKYVRAHMEFLASDEMKGRGSGTEFEKLAGLYIASQLKQYGIKPAGDKNGAALGEYIQTVAIDRTQIGEISLTAGDVSAKLTGLRLSDTGFTGPLKRVSLAEKAGAGSIAFVNVGTEPLTRQQFSTLFSSDAQALVIVAPPATFQQLSGFARRGLSITKIRGVASGSSASIFLISEEDAKAFDGISEGTEVAIKAVAEKTSTSYTWNAVGKIQGSSANGEAILLSAHMDHLGVRENAPGDDKIYNGADDDASGCVAVLELARVLSQGEQPKRTILFAFFGSEEAGGFGAQYFVGNLGFPLEKLVANLQFEMLGRPDAKVGQDELWLTGFERSNLGPKLAETGAKIVADPHPDQNFFERSDNITLARKGVVAHTVSSFGLHTDYHQASDEIKTIDFAYMTKSVGSMVEPVVWLANTTWKPGWNEGMKP